MPALWMLSQTNQNLLTFEPLSQLVSQRQAIWFLVSMVLFNAYEDLVAMVMSGIKDRSFIAGHVVHFLTLLDFSLLFFQQAYVSKVAKNEGEGTSAVNLPDVTTS